MIITNQELNKLTLATFAERLAQVNLASTNNIGNFVKSTYFDNKLKHDKK